MGRLVGRPARWAILLLGLLCYHRHGASALDIVLKSYSCDQALPIFATELYMSCDGNARCTVGRPSNLFGIFSYSELYEFLNGTVFVDAEISLIASKYQLASGVMLDLCALESKNGNCPGNGEYKFDVQFTLPEIDDAWSWFSTGYSHKGKLVLYASKNARVLVGYCELGFTAMVTKSSQTRNPPSAVMAGILLMAALFICVMLCCCWADYYKFCSCHRGVEDEDYTTYNTDLIKNNSLRDDPGDWVDVKTLDGANPHISDASLLANGWLMARDPSTGRSYFANPGTGESRWEPPVDDKTVMAANLDQTVEQSRADDVTVNSEVDEAAENQKTPVSSVILTRVDSNQSRSNTPKPASRAGSPAPASPTLSMTDASANAAANPGTASPLPSGWIKVRDPNSGRLYYANPATGESSWETPFNTMPVYENRNASPLTRLFGAARMQRSPPRSPGRESSSAPPVGWIRVKDPNTGREYFANPTTGESSWRAP